MRAPQPHRARARVRAASGCLGCLLAFGLSSGPAAAQSPAAADATPGLAAFSTATGAQPPAPWRIAGLPGDRAPLARFDLVEREGARVLRLQTDKAYGTLIHPLPPAVPRPGAMLRWRWRLDQPVAGANLRTRAGDDSALKLCLMFDLPLERLGLWERQLLRLARASSGEALPAATLCYVWDATLPAGTLLPNAYSPRVRFLVLDGADAPLGRWRTHERSIAADFLRAFGHETTEVPPLLAVVAGADSDNTGGSSLSFLGDVQWVR